MYFSIYENKYHYWRPIGTEEKNYYFYLGLFVDDEYTFQHINNYLNCPIFDEIIKVHNGLFSVYDQFCYFKDRQDIEMVIETLEPYLIMAKLTR